MHRYIVLYKQKHKKKREGKVLGAIIKNTVGGIGLFFSFLAVGTIVVGACWAAEGRRAVKKVTA
jgi:hypothetical protein